MGQIGTRQRDGRSAGRPSYIPVYTLHDMHQETRKQLPVIICSGCAHPIPSPRGRARIQCRDCGRRMNIVPISPATQTSQAG